MYAYIGAFLFYQYIPDLFLRHSVDAHFCTVKRSGDFSFRRPSSFCARLVDGFLFFVYVSCILPMTNRRNSNIISVFRLFSKMQKIQDIPIIHSSLSAFYYMARGH